MVIKCLRTGKVLENNLTLTSAGEAMERRIRESCADWQPHVTEALVAKWKRGGGHPFMFEVFANERDAGSK